MQASLTKLDLGRLLQLPSESQIHFVNFLGLALMAWLYVTVIPAIAILYGENRPIAGTIFALGSCLVFGLLIRRRYKEQLALPPRKIFLQSILQSTIRKAGRLKLPRLARYLRRFQTPEMEVLSSQGKGASFLEFFRQRFMSSGGDIDRFPAVYWVYQDLRCAARVVGSRSRPAVVVSAGLLAKYFRDPGLVNIYLLHEFGHLANHDLEILAATIAVLGAWRLTTLIVSLAAALLLIPYIDSSIFTALLLMVSTLWVLSLLVIWLFLARYAGMVISLRELYADVQALFACGEERAAFVRAIGASVRPARKVWLGKLRSLTSLRLVHLSPGERLDFMARPAALLEPKTSYFILTALLLLAIQSSPFLAGYGHNGLRLSLLFPWILTAFAYTANVSRSLLGFAKLHNVAGSTPRWRLGLYCTLILLLPVLSIRELYQTLILLGSGDWGALGSTVVESLKGMAPKPGDLSVLLLIGCVVLALTLGGRLAVAQSESPHRFHRQMLWIWGAGLGIETIFFIYHEV